MNSQDEDTDESLEGGSKDCFIISTRCFVRY